MKFLKLWDLSGNSERTMSKGLLTKNEHFGANCLWDVNRLYSENSIQTLLIFWRVDQKKFGRVCMEFSKHNWATSLLLRVQNTGIFFSLLLVIMNLLYLPSLKLLHWFYVPSTILLTFFYTPTPQKPLIYFPWCPLTV